MASNSNRVKRVRKKKRMFLRTRAWVNYILSSIIKDRGTIPTNIGDKILITNNLYATRYYLSSVIQIRTLGLKTPVTLMGEITNCLRKEDCFAICDFTLKNSKYEYEAGTAGVESRATMWEAAIDAPNITDREKEIAARCLYTKDLADSGEQLFRTRMFIFVRAKTGTELTNAERIIYNYLHTIEAGYEQVTGNLKDILAYTSILSNVQPKNIKDLRPIVTSTKTMVQLLPNSGSLNEVSGSFLGYNVLNHSLYMIDWNRYTTARNVYVVAPSGVGKTVLALNACCSARENGMAVCVQDIKGNEFTRFTQSTGGYIVSLRQMSTEYMNSWKMKKEDTTVEMAESYYNSRLNFSKEQIKILTGIRDVELLVELDELLEEFHESLYISLGVSSENMNSWKYTECLNPYVVYDYLEEYMTPQIQAKYYKIAKNVLNALRISMSRSGSKSYLFQEEFEYAEILKAPTLMFDFGILDGATDMTDTTVFRLKFAYMRKLNAEYVAYKYSLGIKVFKVLEESQVAVRDKDILAGYIEEYTLRRAQGQTTWLLGNSVAALANNTASAPLIENTKALLIGDVGETAKRVLYDKFDLEEYTDLIDLVGSTVEYENSFLFVNWMEKNPVVPILKIKFDNIKEHDLFTPVAVSNSVV